MCIRDSSKPCQKIVQLNEEVIKGKIKELVRGSVEEALNELLEAEAEKLTPVSYTHLDVYKRQPLTGGAIPFPALSLTAAKNRRPAV